MPVGIAREIRGDMRRVAPALDDQPEGLQFSNGQAMQVPGGETTTTQPICAGVPSGADNTMICMCATGFITASGVMKETNAAPCASR